MFEVEIVADLMNGGTTEVIGFGIGRQPDRTEKARVDHNPVFGRRRLAGKGGPPAGIAAHIGHPDIEVVLRIPGVFTVLVVVMHV